jgi:hypothetical protein
VRLCRCGARPSWTPKHGCRVLFTTSLAAAARLERCRGCRRRRGGHQPFAHAADASPTTHSSRARQLEHICARIELWHLKLHGSPREYCSRLCGRQVCRSRRSSAERRPMPTVHSGVGAFAQHLQQLGCYIGVVLRASRTGPKRLMSYMEIRAVGETRTARPGYAGSKPTSLVTEPRSCKRAFGTRNRPALCGRAKPSCGRRLVLPVGLLKAHYGSSCAAKEVAHLAEAADALHRLQGEAAVGCAAQFMHQAQRTRRGWRRHRAQEAGQRQAA